MFKNYFLITIRNLRKNGFYSFINITGLSIGITCSILILLWVFDETSFNKFLPKYDRLYQVWANALKPILTELLGPPAKEDNAPAPTGDPSAAR